MTSSGYLLFWREEGRTDRVHGSISLHEATTHQRIHRPKSRQSLPDTHPSFVVETTGVVQMFKVLHVRFRSPEIQVADLKVAPEMTSVVSLAAIVTDEIHGVVFRDILWVGLDEICKKGIESATKRKAHARKRRTFRGLPKRWDSLYVFKE
jgi:hypothetical protein